LLCMDDYWEGFPAGGGSAFGGKSLRPDLLCMDDYWEGFPARGGLVFRSETYFAE
jgi:hypothetical protein